MKVDMVMPQMGESIAEGTIVKWLKKVGDAVAKDENILEISTDKVDSEIPSPAAGTLIELLAAEGDTVPVGSVVAKLDTETGVAPAPAVPSPPPPAVAAPTPPPPAAPVPRAAPTPAPSTPAAAPAAVDTAPSPGGGRGDGEGRFYSPLVRSIAHSEGIPIAELSQIQGSGQGGRVTRDDLLAYVERRKSGGAARPATGAGALPAAPLPFAATSHAPEKVPSEGAPVIVMPSPAETRKTAEGLIDVIPMDHIRQKIAEHMVRSKATSPHVASITEVDMTRVVRWREANRDAFERQEGFKLTFTPVFIQATARALKDFPYVNASIEGTTVLVKRFVNIGMAVATDYGLVVPVVRGADGLSFRGLARAVNDLATRARSKGLRPDEVTGGTFSVTNMGTVGTLFGIPIIAQPQVGILGIGSIQKRPVVRDDAIAIREMMYMCLSYDHRLVDGAMGGSFVERVAFYLETMDLG
jgi:2-oxoglutarate dehydrogenase dihydrolipoamide succinyltransferase (E2 component)